MACVLPQINLNFINEFFRNTIEEVQPSGIELGYNEYLTLELERANCLVWGSYSGVVWLEKSHPKYDQYLELMAKRAYCDVDVAITGYVLDIRPTKLKRIFKIKAIVKSVLRTTGMYEILVYDDAEYSYHCSSNVSLILEKESSYNVTYHYSDKTTRIVEKAEYVPYPTQIQNGKEK